MRLYESVFILQPSQSDEETNGVIEKMKGILERNGASILKVDNWGKKKLAYEVQHERRGTYVLLQFEAEGKVVAELERFYKQEDSILKLLTVRLDEPLDNATMNSETESQNDGVQ